MFERKLSFRDRRGSLLLVILFLCTVPGASVLWADTYKGAPPDPSEVWVPDVDVSHANSRGSKTAPSDQPPPAVLAPEKKYRLSELIDIAQKNNPKTRIAWENARQAAVAVNMAKGFYYPVLSLAAIGLYEHVPLPFPKLLSGNRGYITADTGIVRVEAVMEWLLLDFGRRTLSVKTTARNQIAANYAFNAQHQQIAFDVATHFYTLNALNAQVQASRAAFADAKLIEESAQALRERGMATVPEVLIARQARVQSAFDLETVLAEQRDAQVALAGSVGVTPTTEFQIADLSKTPVPTEMPETVDEATEKALAQRLDLQALEADVQASETAVRLARAAFWPQVFLRGNAGPAYNNFKVDSFSWASVFEPQYGVALALEWPIFNGFETKSRTALAESEQAKKQSELALLRDTVVQEVWKAYSAAGNALRRHKAAESLLEASQSAYDSALASYQQGLATLPEVTTGPSGTLSGPRRSERNPGRSAPHLCHPLLRHRRNVDRPRFS